MRIASGAATRPGDGGAPPSPATPAAGPGARGRWPRWLRRGPLETAAMLLIGAGVLMLLQPFSIVLFKYSFATTVAGTAMFMIVSKFPD